MAEETADDGQAQTAGNKVRGMSVAAIMNVVICDICFTQNRPPEGLQFDHGAVTTRAGNYVEIMAFGCFHPL